jgi:hypothetical protein
VGTTFIARQTTCPAPSSLPSLVLRGCTFTATGKIVAFWPVGTQCGFMPSAQRTQLQVGQACDHPAGANAGDRRGGCTSLRGGVYNLQCRPMGGRKRAFYHRSTEGDARRIWTREIAREILSAIWTREILVWTRADKRRVAATATASTSERLRGGETRPGQVVLRSSAFSDEHSPIIALFLTNLTTPQTLAHHPPRVIRVCLFAALEHPPQEQRP